MRTISLAVVLCAFAWSATAEEALTNPIADEPKCSFICFMTQGPPAAPAAVDAGVVSTIPHVRAADRQVARKALRVPAQAQRIFTPHRIFAEGPHRLHVAAIEPVRPTHQRRGRPVVDEGPTPAAAPATAQTDGQIVRTPVESSAVSEAAAAPDSQPSPVATSPFGALSAIPAR